MIANTAWFTSARFGMFVHYGLYSLLGRGEWVLNREGIPVDEYKRLADRFTAEKFDAGAICDLAIRWGMRYIILTTMHHDGFRLYDTALSDFSTMKTAARRDLVAETITAARSRGLRVGLYHSLNNWTDQPDAASALEDPKAYEVFIKNAFERVRELVTKYNPIDVLWYDGWWPFNAEGWRAQEMNAMVREIQPHILLNNRNGLPGDFGTPEGHVSAPKPWRPWEACMTLNNSWGYHAGDHDWKSPGDVIDLLAACANGRGNLLLNVGPRGDGSIPSETIRVLNAVGEWIRRNGECIFDTDLFTFGLRDRADHRSDWSHHGPLNARGNVLYLLARRWPGREFALNGVEGNVKLITLLATGEKVSWHQTEGRVVLKDLAAADPDPICSVFRFECDRATSLYLCGGLRTPGVPHPPYDPCRSDIVNG
ncbi:MAG TPA: alpha-L-fucosidase [Tepidisphaeraceae bacterium]|nr:alpha-L-fucosidase [Tepidisphaeraceae bacterium]